MNKYKQSQIITRLVGRLLASNRVIIPKAKEFIITNDKCDLVICKVISN